MSMNAVEMGSVITSAEQALRCSGLVTMMEEWELKALAQRLEYRHLPTGSLIKREGDPGDECFVIISGMVQVFTLDQDGVEVALDLCKTGHFIGEQALLAGGTGRCNVSLRAITEVDLQVIPKAQFRKLLSVNEPLKSYLRTRGQEQLKRKHIKLSPLFRSLVAPSGEDLYYREEEFQDGEIIFRSGDTADKMYLIIEGAADVCHEHADGRTPFRQLGPGGIFGEFGLLNNKPRSATLIARGRLTLLSVDGSSFIERYQQSPQLQNYIQCLNRLYKLPVHGFVTQLTGKFMNHDCLTTLSYLFDGTAVVSNLVVGHDIFNLKVVKEFKTPAKVIRYEGPDKNVERELRLVDNRIVELSVIGPWDELYRIYEMAIEEHVVYEEALELFKQQGSLLSGRITPSFGDSETVCLCLQIRRGELQDSIDHGISGLKKLSKKTGAGSACGSCRALLEEMLGEADWTPVRVCDVHEIAGNIRSFRFASQTIDFKPAKPGQFIIVQALVKGQWIHRPYTISSAAGEIEFREITVKRQPHGQFSNWLFDNTDLSHKNLTIRVSDPLGDFYADLKDSSPIVCLVAGMGITPALSICRSVMQQATGHRLHIDYSVPHPDQFAFQDELKEAAKHSNITINFRATRKQGRLDHDDVQRLTHICSDANYFICGPKDYESCARSFLDKEKVQRHKVHVETYTPVGGVPQTADKGYFYLGLAMLAAFFAQSLLGIRWEWLESLQANLVYKVASGTFVLLFIGAQFFLSAARSSGKFGLVARYFRLHKVQGAFGPLIFYLHSTQLAGYGYLLLLTILFFANLLWALFNQEVAAKSHAKRWYSYYWLAAHVTISVLLVPLAIYHAYDALAFK